MARRTTSPAGKLARPPRAPTLRLVPVVIFASVLMLGVKLGDLWTGVAGLAVPQSLAQQAGAPKAAPQAAAPPAKTADAPRKTSGTPPAAEKNTQATARGNDALPDDPALFSQAEIDLLQKLADRRKQLDAWTKQLEMREGLLKAAEQRIDRKVGELRTIQAKIKDMLRQYDKEQEDKLKSLVKIYETMKPKDAARIFMELEMKVLLDVVERMSERRVAPIIAELDPTKAKDVTAELAKRRKIGEDARRALPSTASEEPPLPSSDGAVPGNG